VTIRTSKICSTTQLHGDLIPCYGRETVRTRREGTEMPPHSQLASVNPRRNGGYPTSRHCQEPGASDPWTLSSDPHPRPSDPHPASRARGRSPRCRCGQRNALEISFSASSTRHLLLLGLLHLHTPPSLPPPQGSNRAPAVSTEVTPLVAFSGSLASHRYSRPSVTAIYLGPSPRQCHGPLSRSRAEQRSGARPDPRAAARRSALP
jgi:hypothetical protein